METPLYFALALIIMGIAFIASIYLRSFIRPTSKDYKRHLK
ncbi:hypothetical protein [Rhodocytophaga rosea]|nr:hypothetical protein [Rhodocytophaga rosea]